MKRAFTLIELLVVMAIMGILTIITVSQFTTAKVKARDAQRKADLSSVSKALLMYYADYQHFPIANDVDLINGGSFADASGYVYMKVMPKENKNHDDCPYYYLVDTDPDRFAVLGCLENLEDGDGWTKGATPVRRSISCGGNTGYNFGFTSPNVSLDDILTATCQFEEN